MKALQVIVTCVVGIGVLAAAVVVSFILLKTAPKMEPEEEKQASKIVRTIVLEPTDEKISVLAWGSVLPAEEVTMRPQVGGRIIHRDESLVPGGRFKEGEEVARIDPIDYELTLKERKADLEEANSEYEVEQGRQIIAKREWEELRSDLPSGNTDPSLALRKPHLKRTEALVAKAENAIERAELDLKRTRITAPFNSMVMEENVDVGQLIESGSDMCRLVGTDRFWIQATLPMNDLGRINLPKDGNTGGATARVFLSTGEKESDPWTGRVIRLLPDLEQTGRMARLLIEIEDPFGLKSGDDSPGTPLLLGSYVRIEIDAGLLMEVLTIPRTALHEGNRIWMVGSDNRIRIVEPEILWTRSETVLIPDIRKDGERLIVSELKAALPGMEVNPQPLDSDSDSQTSAQ